MDSNPPGLLRPDYEADRRSVGAKLGFHPPGAPKLGDHLGRRRGVLQHASRHERARVASGNQELTFSLSDLLV